MILGFAMIEKNSHYQIKYIIQYIYIGNTVRIRIKQVTVIMVENQAMNRWKVDLPTLSGKVSFENDDRTTAHTTNTV